MILSQACKYGIRAIFHLAQGDDVRRLSMDIARELHIPEPFLAKILQDLARHEILQSTRGRGGGFKLARSLDQITPLEVAQALDPQFTVGCVLGPDACNEEDPCPLHSCWAPLKEELQDLLEGNSIRQILSAFHSESK